eukprot:TRINITY_DN5512_c0_g1_i3.p1 TRINITY_DN5512_c0_g1~~TRINITY_DN5512_c0_g1_i3.p1  ORF type:complete len:524 (-),score=112.88 TRINITY_DN5512_c0_g1_i3:38-1468(-)
MDPTEVKAAFKAGEKLKPLLDIVEAIMEAKLDSTSLTKPIKITPEEQQKREQVVTALLDHLSARALNKAAYYEPQNRTVQRLFPEKDDGIDRPRLDDRNTIPLMSQSEYETDAEDLETDVETDAETDDDFNFGGSRSFFDTPEMEVEDFESYEKKKSWKWGDTGDLTSALPEKVIETGRRQRLYRRSAGFLEELKEYFEWPDTLPAQIHMIVMSPVIFICHCVIHWSEECKYMKLFYVLHPPCALLAVFFFNELFPVKVVIAEKELSYLILWLLPVSIILSVIVFFTTDRDKPPGPWYNLIFVIEGLLSAFIFIEFLADELVQILRELGIMWNIPDGIMGLTVLAWGNSIPEIIGNIILARKGYPEMALSACYSGCISNVLIGLGIAFAVDVAKHGTIFLTVSTESPEPALTNMSFVGFFFILFGLLWILITVPAFQFRYTKINSIGLIVIYVAFIVVSALLLFDVFGTDWVLWEL